MKKILLVAAVLNLFAFSAFADDQSDGCGLGWQVTKKTSFFATTTRGTTNVFVPPTFGMTTGTMGCTQHSLAKNEMPAVEYAVANRDALVVEMAEGQGENLQAFSRTLGCEDEAYSAFGKMTQAHFETITKDGNSTGVGLYKAIKGKIQADPYLAMNCGTLAI